MTFIGPWPEVVQRFEYARRLLSPGNSVLTNGQIVALAEVAPDRTGVLGLYHACVGTQSPIVDATAGRILHETTLGHTELRVEPGNEPRLAQLTLIRKKKLDLVPRSLLLAILTHFGAGNAALNEFWPETMILSVKQQLAFAGISELFDGYAINPAFWRERTRGIWLGPEFTQPGS